MGEMANPISIRSKRRITEALLALMETEPFAKISVKDIVDKAGLTRQTFYHNFATKEDVLLYREDELVEGFVAGLAENQVYDWEDIICFFFRYWQEHNDFMHLLVKNNLMYLLSMRMPEYYMAVQKVHFSETSLTDTEARLWYAFVTGAVVNLLVSWLENPGNLSARDLSKLVMTMMDGTMMQRNELENAAGARKAVELLASGISSVAD